MFLVVYYCTFPALWQLPALPGLSPWQGMLSARRSSTACTALGITREQQAAALCQEEPLDNSGDEAKNLANLALQRGTDTAHLKQLLCSTLLFLALHLSACMA